MFKRLKIQAEDELRFSPKVRALLASRIFLKTPDVVTASSDEAARVIHTLCQAARLATDDSMMKKAEARIRRQLPKIEPARIRWAEFLADFGGNRIQKGIVLKPYVSERERGIVFISFDNQMARLAKSTDLEAFTRRYTLVLAPQWCPPHTITSWLFPLIYPDEIICLISNTRDLIYFPRISEKYVMVPLYASSWVDPREYRPVPVEQKNIDIYMLANFAKYKRHHALFAALRDLPREYRVVLHGQRESGRTRETLIAEADAFGVRDRFEVHENVTNEALHDAMVHAKVSLILSRREGSCVAVVESMFANTPVGVYADAEIGSRAFVNEHTGRLLQHQNLAAQLKEFVESSAKYEPRKWVMENGVGCLASSEMLNEALKRHALERGAQWTRDIAPLRWHPNPEFFDPEDVQKVRSAYEDIERNYGITLG